MTARSRLDSAMGESQIERESIPKDSNHLDRHHVKSISVASNEPRKYFGRLKNNRFTANKLSTDFSFALSPFDLEIKILDYMYWLKRG